MFGLVSVADGAGPGYDVSELATYLNDAVLPAPSMLLRLPVAWSAAGDHAFDVTLRDAGNQVTARVHLDDRGAPTVFSTADRYRALSRRVVRTRWSTPVQGWRKVGDRWRPTRAAAVWHLAGGPFTYAEFRCALGDASYNVPPAGARQAAPARRAPR